MRFKLGPYIINMVKAVIPSSKGKERPGHKYCKRVPLSGGGYDYYYPNASGKCGPAGTNKERLTTAQARTRNPEKFNPHAYKFSLTSESAKEIVGFKYGNGEKIADLKSRYIKGAWTQPAGYFKESMMLLSIPVGEGWINDIDDAVWYLDNMYDDLKDRTDARSVEIKENIENWMMNVNVLSNLNTRNFTGKKVIETFWTHSAQTWVTAKANLEAKSGSALNSAVYEFTPVGKETGKTVIADYLLQKRETDGSLSTIDVYSLKVNGSGNKPVSLKEGSVRTAGYELYKDSGNPVLVDMGIELEKIVKETKREIAEKRYSNGANLLSARYKQAEVRLLGLDKPDQQTPMQKDRLAAFVEMVNKRLHSVHDDPRSKDTILNVTGINPDGSTVLYQSLASELSKGIDNWLSKGSITVRIEQTGKYRADDGKIYTTYGVMSFVGGPPDNRSAYVYRETRNSKDAIQLRANYSWLIGRMKGADLRDKGRSAQTLADYNGLKRRPTIKSEEIELEKAQTVAPKPETAPEATTGRRTGAKYLRKIITPSGKVRYIYEETKPRKEKEETKPVKRSTFSSRIDSIDKSYKALFEEACSEISDEHFMNINAGVKAIRFTKDTETYLDFLGASEKQRQNRELGSSSATFGVYSGKMAFNLSQFPGEIPDIVKKVVMLHEVGHAYFYGTLRMKENNPLTGEKFETDDKSFIKNSSKFADAFAKLDKDMRKGVDDSLEIEGLSGKEKEEQLQAKMLETFIDSYAIADEFEHFAQAFSYYFIAPEILKRKEKAVYDHFNSYFKKYA